MIKLKKNNIYIKRIFQEIEEEFYLKNKKKIRFNSQIIKVN